MNTNWSNEKFGEFNADSDSMSEASTVNEVETAQQSVVSRGNNVVNFASKVNNFNFNKPGKYAVDLHGNGLPSSHTPLATHGPQGSHKAHCAHNLQPPSHRCPKLLNAIADGKSAPWQIGRIQIPSPMPKTQDDTASVKSTKSAPASFAVYRK